MSSSPALAPTQHSRLKQFRCARVVDAHCHLLPAVDDGPPDLGESLALARMLVEDGVTDVIATPHQLGRWDGSNLPDTVRQGVAALQAELKRNGIPLTVHAGGEVRLDERIPALLKSGQVQTLADNGRWLLLELPPSLTIDPKMIVAFMTRTGARIVLAHAERYDFLNADPAAVQKWLEQGVAIQVNAASLLGGSGNRAEKAAWGWLGSGRISLIASDAHSTGSRRPRIGEAINVMLQRADDDAVRRVCIENPIRVLEGSDLV